MAHDPYNTTNEDAVSNLSMLSTSTMRSSLYFHEKPDRFEQQAGPLADILDLHQDVRDRQASGTSSNSQAMIKALKALQDKIRALELERAAAAEKFRHLGQQAEQHKQVHKQQHNARVLVNRSSQYSSPPSDSSTEGAELKKKLESFSSQYQGQHQELEQLRSKIRQAESDRQLAVNKAKLLEEELNNQQKVKAHEDKLRELEEQRVKEQQERELKRQREEVEREQEQLAKQQKLIRHQLEATKLQQQEQYHKSGQLSQKHSLPERHHNERATVDPIIPLSSRTSEGSTLTSRHRKTVSGHGNTRTAGNHDYNRDDLLSKLKSLEQEHQRLLNSHNLTEKRLKVMENKLLEEKHQRKLLQDCTEEYHSNHGSHDLREALHTKTNTLPTKPRPSHSTSVKKKRQKLKKATTTTTTTTSNMYTVCPTVHYRANYQDVPFVVGTSTGQSHSVTANYQRILSLMKSHSPALCGRVPLVRKNSFTGGIAQQELACMLRDLEDEYALLQCEQQELARVLQERSTVDSSDELTQLQDELCKIEARLTNKAEHIKIIKTQSKNHKRKHCTSHKRSSSVTIPPDGQVEIVTTVKPSSPHTPKMNRKLLYNMKTLQDTLQRDDLSWN